MFRDFRTDPTRDSSGCDQMSTGAISSNCRERADEYSNRGPNTAPATGETANHWLVLRWIEDVGPILDDRDGIILAIMPPSTTKVV